jgi:sulfotransferase
MRNGIHFIAGLPRSGSTLLAALLRQNPRLHAAMSSPVSSLVSGLMRQMSQDNEGAVFIEDLQRSRILKAVVDAYYADIHPRQVVFDTNRQWATRLPLLARLWPKAKVICCVRSPSWALDSIERLTRANALEPSGIFKFEANGTVYSRAEGLMSGTGMIGYALNALREAVFDERREKLLLVRYESLVATPQAVLDQIYEFVGEPRFKHDPNHIEQDFDAITFDQRLGAPGLHSVGAKVRASQRNTCLPPDLFARYVNDAFWERPAEVPTGVKVI